LGRGLGSACSFEGAGGVGQRIRRDRASARFSGGKREMKAYRRRKLCGVSASRHLANWSINFFRPGLGMRIRFKRTTAPHPSPRPRGGHATVTSAPITRRVEGGSRGEAGRRSRDEGLQGRRDPVVESSSSPPHCRLQATGRGPTLLAAIRARLVSYCFALCPGDQRKA